MEKSASIKELAKALIVFHNKCDKIKKDSENPYFKSRYASLSTIQEAIREPLGEAGLAYSQLPDGENGLTTILMHADSGEFLQSSYLMKPVKDDPQGRGSAITYQKRYALSAVLGLQIDDDDDANYATHGNNKPSENQHQEDERPWLKEDQLKEMLAFIKDGKKEAVKKRMQAYRMKKEYKAQLETALNN